jgi:uncharacterized protein (DUF58 family)
MIVPRIRLLFWTGMVVLPFSAIGTIAPDESTLCLIAIGLLLVLVIIDAFSSDGGLQHIHIEFPNIVRLSRGREGKIDFTAENKGNKNKKLRVGLAFPPALRAESDILLLDLRGEERTSFHWHCTPLRRGSYSLDHCHIEGTSPLGFWDIRRNKPIACEVRVYPDLLAERRQLAALFLNRDNFGIHAIRQLGQGRDFEKLREYVQGDSYDHIHWKVTAKRGQPVTKVFQIEKTQEVYVIVDASRLSSRCPVAAGQVRLHDSAVFPLTIMERFVTGALAMGAAAKKQGDHFGIVTFGNGIKTFLRAKNGPGHYNDCREALCEVQPEIVNPDFSELFSFIGIKLRKRALLIILTSLDDPALAESFINGIGLISNKHLVVVNMLRPAGVKQLFSDPRVESLDDIYGALGGHLIWQDLGETGKVLLRRGVRFSILDNETMCTQLVSQYMELKQRQLL